MSIEIQRAKEFLNHVESLQNDSSKIFYLFTEEDAICQSNFLCQVNIEGQYIIDYLTDILKSKPVLTQYEIKGNSSFQWEVRIPSLSWRDIGVIKPSQDRIFYFDIAKREFQVITRPIKHYEEMMNDKIELNLSEVSDWWKRFENFTLTKRLKVILECLTDKNCSIWHRLEVSLHVLKTKRSYIEKQYKEKAIDIERHNEALKKFYEEDVERQKWYREFAPSQIEIILSKQEKLKRYFEGLGYKENSNLTWDWD